MTDQTVKTWTRRMRRKIASEYLLEVHGLEFSEKALRNRNASGLPPKPEYLGAIPFYRPEVLDEFAERAFTPESPVTVLRRRDREQHRAQEVAERKAAVRPRRTERKAATATA
jgi:hypothetical protein